MTDAPKPASSLDGSPWRARLGHQVGRLGDVFRAESLLLAVLSGSFLTRWLLADRNSYWLDEHYSVAIYGVWNETALDAVRHLAQTSVHPPLYQFVLYHWMSWFGDSEVATRSLSNLYVTLAALFLYLLLKDAFSRRVALASVVTFSLMYTPTYYGLETRSYAQTIFLVTLSSYLLLRLMRTAADRGWRLALISPLGSLFTLANAALLLTHYYNAFFWVAQGIVAGVFVLRERPPRRWPSGVGVLAGIYGLQAAIFLGVWGRVFLNDYTRRAGDFAVEQGDLRGPLAILRNSVVLRNIDPTRLVAWIGLAVAVVMLIRAFVAVARRTGLTLDRRRAWTILYLVAWLVLPLVMVYLVFATVGVARYSARFFVFSVVPLAPLLVLTAEEAARLVSDVLERVRGVGLHAGWSIAAISLGVAALIVPGTYAAATAPKADWRGTAQAMVAIVQSNPEASYVIFEPAFRSTPVFDYYLSRYSDTVRVTATIRRVEERRGENFSFERRADFIQEHDFLILPFTHHRVTDFAIALEKLEETYDLHLWQIDSNGKGLVIFSTSPRPSDVSDA